VEFGGVIEKIVGAAKVAAKSGHKDGILSAWLVTEPEFAPQDPADSPGPAHDLFAVDLLDAFCPRDKLRGDGFSKTVVLLRIRQVTPHRSLLFFRDSQ
jgi:hypothetical protein